MASTFRALCALQACALMAAPSAALAADPAKPLPNGSLVEHDVQVAEASGGPHDGLGTSVGYVFFKNADQLRFSLRKRVLHPGATIGYHAQTKDEVYYILSGRGLMTMDGQDFEVAPGDAMLTRVGSSHGLKQQGDEDLVLMVVFEQKT